MLKYYGELCTLMYEKDKSIAEEEELAFYLSFVTDRKMKVLEPMCGNGRMLIPFMQKGVDIEGFDLSADMLNACIKKAGNLGMEARVFQQDLKEYTANKTYDFIMIPIGSFSLLPDDIVDQSLQNLREALAPGGKMLVTIMSDDIEAEEIAEWVESNREGEVVEYKKVRFDRERKILHIELKYSMCGDERIELMDFPIRLYDPDEFTEILKRNGFREVKIHQINNGSSVLIFECING